MNEDAATIKPPSIGALIAKVAFGILFIIYGFVPPEGNTSGLAYTATSLVIGVALIVWGVVPYLNKKRAWEASQAQERAAMLNTVRICKACGAKSTGSHCEYCGAPLD